MSEHLVLDVGNNSCPRFVTSRTSMGLELLAMEQPVRDSASWIEPAEPRPHWAYRSSTVDPAEHLAMTRVLKASISSLAEMAKIGEEHGVIVCVKAHVGASIYNTPRRSG